MNVKKHNLKIPNACSHHKYTMKGWESLESLENARNGSFLSHEGDTLSRVYIIQRHGLFLVRVACAMRSGCTTTSFLHFEETIDH